MTCRSSTVSKPRPFSCTDTTIRQYRSAHAERIDGTELSSKGIEPANQQPEHAVSKLYRGDQYVAS